MSAERDTAEAVDVTEALREGAEGLASAQRSLAELTKLVRSIRERAPWHPEPLQIACEEELLRRLESCAGRIEIGQQQLVRKRAELLRAAHIHSPFVCPAELLTHIHYVTQLSNYARGRKLQSFLQAYAQVPRDVPGDAALGAASGGCPVSGKQRWRKPQRRMPASGPGQAGRHGRSTATCT